MKMNIIFIQSTSQQTKNWIIWVLVLIHGKNILFSFGNSWVVWSKITRILFLSVTKAYNQEADIFLSCQVIPVIHCALANANRPSHIFFDKMFLCLFTAIYVFFFSHVDYIVHIFGYVDTNKLCQCKLRM